MEPRGRAEVFREANAEKKRPMKYFIEAIDQNVKPVERKRGEKKEDWLRRKAFLSPIRLSGPLRSLREARQWLEGHREGQDSCQPTGRILCLDPRTQQLTVAWTDEAMLGPVQ